MEEETVEPKTKNKDPPDSHGAVEGRNDDGNKDILGDVDEDDDDDDEFRQWILEEMTSMSPQVHVLYPELFATCALAVTKWRIRYRGNPPLWRRLFKKERVVKEVVESIPVIDAVQTWMNEPQASTNEKVTIMDLCSGKGFLSMLLSEILDPARVAKCVLVDKGWPMCHATMKSHHISWEHIYGNVEDENAPHYFDTWPIPLVTSKQNLKQTREIRQMQDRFSKEKGPVLVLAVHLCGTLSIQAVRLFRTLPNAQLLLLKPCCLPDIYHAKNAEVFQIGSYTFPTKDVCSRGKWKSQKAEDGNATWKGPPRWHLRGKFEKWCTYLFEAIGHSDEETAAEEGNSDGNPAGIPYCLPVHQIDSRRFEVPLQTKGGFQNTFLVAERAG